MTGTETGNSPTRPRPTSEARPLGALTGTPRRWALIYLAAVGVAELFTSLVQPQVGLILHALLLMTLFAHAAATSRRATHRLLLGLTLAPLIRLASLSIPLADFPRLFSYLLVSLPLFAATLAAIRVLDLDADQIGLNLRRPLLQLGVSAIGVLLGYVEYQILRPEPLTEGLSMQELWVPALILLVCTGVSEELIFRGLLHVVSREVLGWWAIPYVAALAAVLYVGHQSTVNVAFAFGVGMLFGWIRERSGSLLGVSLAHGLTNIVLFLLVPPWPGIGGGI